MGLASLLGAEPAYAVAMAAPQGGGRYLVVGHDGGSTLLGTFAGRADLSCHSAAQAAALNESIARSGVVHGSLRARGPSTIVCGFVEPTRARCWQYAPDKGSYAEVGEWIT